jgi:hypothetical protein
MIGDWLRSLFSPEQNPPPPARSVSPRKLEPVLHRSPALSEFFQNVFAWDNPGLLDLAGASASSGGFLVQPGRRIYSEDFLATLEHCFQGEDFYGNQSEEARARDFLMQIFDGLGGQPVHGALFWDSFQYLTPSLLELTLKQLHDRLEHGALIHAVFYDKAPDGKVPGWSFRVESENTVLLQPRGFRQVATHYPVLDMETLFSDFQTLKHFMPANGLREVLVRR